MTIPRIAKIHFVYQFIILTLLLFAVVQHFAIGNNEILPYIKYMFLALIPVFCYQLMIVLCCTELLPLPSWINVQEIAPGSTEETVIETTSKEQKVDLQPIQKQGESSEPAFPKKLSSFKYSLKNRKTEILSKNKVLEAQETDLSGTKVEANSRLGEYETTKSYYFPYRQKRSEQWIDQNETTRPYKVRNLKSGNENENSKSPLNQKSPSRLTSYVEEQKSPIQLLAVKENQIDENGSPDLQKSYSFPFRQKKLKRFLEQEDDSENVLNIPTMPPWKSLNYCKSGNSCGGRRKSISTEALNEELKLIKSSCEQKERNDFTQSMELTGTLSLDACAVKKNPLRSTTSFNKFKQGIVNCFYKNKRESFKTDENKQNDENRKQFFRELFLSKENLNFESVDEETTKQVKSPKPERSKLGGLFRSSYVSYASDSFTDDVKVYSHPRNFKKIE